jgi:UDP-GlcNAc:undecaprenyl-phosphate GlcNAc-1-phosphate transferase
MIWIQSAILLAVAAIATILLTPIAKKIAIRVDAIDYPDARRVNKTPIPRMGGIAMYGGIVITSIVLYAGHELFDWVDPFRSFLGFQINYPLLFTGITFMFAVGIVDDIKGLSAKVKLLGQIIAACLIAASGLLLSNIQNPFVRNEFIQFGWFAYPITVFYLVAFANIINLIDGLDGLAAGIGAISAATIFAFSALASRLDAAVLAVIIVGVCLGFLKYNRHPASIFMGDSGSLLIGVCLGVVSLLAVARSTLVISLLVPIMAAGVPIIDTAMAIIRRLRAHQSVIEPDAGHIHHRLLQAGFSQGKTVAIMWAWTAALSICSIVLAESSGIWRAVAIVVAAAITGFAIAKLKLLEPVLRHHYNPRQKPPKK